MVPRSDSSIITYCSPSPSTSGNASSRSDTHDSQTSSSSPIDSRILQLKDRICGPPIYHHNLPDYATFLPTSASSIHPSEQAFPEAAVDRPTSAPDLASESIAHRSRSIGSAESLETRGFYSFCERYGIDILTSSKDRDSSLLSSDPLVLRRNMTSKQHDLKNGKKKSQRYAAALDAGSPLLDVPPAISPDSMIDLPSPISPTLPPLPLDTMEVPSALQTSAASAARSNSSTNDKRISSKMAKNTIQDAIPPKPGVNSPDVHSQVNRTRSLIITLSIPRRKRKKIDMEDGEIDDTLLSLATGKAPQKRKDIRFSRSPSPYSIPAKMATHTIRKSSSSPSRKTSEHREQAKGASRNKNATNGQQNAIGGKGSKAKGDSERNADVRDSSHRQRHLEQPDPYTRKNIARHFSPSPPPLVERTDSLAGIKRPDNPDDYRNFNQKLQTLATSLKHAGDHGLKAESISWLPHAQHIEAVLLYAYSFWCEDKINPAGSQWTSLVQLLRFVVEHLERRGEHVLAGLCIRLQALTFASIVQNRSRSVRNKASKLNADLGNTNTSSTVDVPNVTSLIADYLKQNVEDSDKIARYWLRSEGRLTADNLRRQFPRVWQHCISPTSSKLDDIDSSSDVGRRFLPPFHWPIHPYTSIPEFVSFARSLLEEWAERRGLSEYRFASGLSL